MALLNYTFNDITTRDMFDFTYNGTEEFLGHRFTHIGSGIFKAEGFFELSVKEIKEMIQGYDDHISVVGILHKQDGQHGNDYDWEDGNRFTVMYAMNELWCDLVMLDRDEPRIFLLWLIENGKGDDIRYQVNTEVKYKDEEYQFEEKYRFFNRGRLFHGIDRPMDMEAAGRQIFEPTNLVKGRLGERTIINIDGAKAAMVEPNIYYFSKDTRYKAYYSTSVRPEIDLNLTFEEPCAMLGYSTDFHPSPTCGIKYFAVGKEASKRLLEIGQNVDCFYHEFKVRPKEENHADLFHVKDVPVPLIMNDEYEMKNWQEIYEKCQALEEELRAEREKEIGRLIETGQAELVVSGTDGMDYRNMKVYYKTLLYRPHESVEYDFVYVVDGKLILENLETSTETEDPRAYISQRAVNVDTITELVISAGVELNNGVNYPVSIVVFDRQEEVKRKFIKSGLLDLVDEMDEAEEIAVKR